MAVEFNNGILQRIAVSLVGSQRFLMEQTFAVAWDLKIQVAILGMEGPEVIAVSGVSGIITGGIITVILQEGIKFGDQELINGCFKFLTKNFFNRLILQ